jgi:CBS domain-containing protein
MKVKEIMTKDVTSVTTDTNAKEALDLLQKMQISGLPVIDEKNKLAGMFTEKEVLSAVLPSYIEKVGRFIYEENPKAVRQKVQMLRGFKVKELMRKDVVTVDEDTTLCEVARLMLTQKARRIPVLNKTKDVVGIVSRGDIVRALFAEYAAE